MSYYVGLDVSMKETYICVMDEKGKIIHQSQDLTDPERLAKRLKSLDVNFEKIGIESGSLSHYLVEELQRRELPAVCIDARKMAAILSVQVNKTDKNDARGIADAMRSGIYKEVAHKSAESIEIGTLMGSRRILIMQKVQISNAVRGFLKTYGIRFGSTGDAEFSQTVKHILIEKSCIVKAGMESLLNCFETVYQEIKSLTKKIEELARKDEDIRRLMTIPGVGAITALAYKIEIDDVIRFKNSRTVGAYLGMTPRQYSSGETKIQGSISKCGSAEVRALLAEAATVMLTRCKKWSKLKAWGLKIGRKHGFKKARMAVARKMAVMMHQMWIKKTDFIYGEPKTKEQVAKPKEAPSVTM